MTFGAEPKDYDVYNFIQNNYLKLNFSPIDVDTKKNLQKKVNYKKLQRKIKKDLVSNNSVTKAQEVIKLQYELKKTMKKGKNSNKLCFY